MIESLNDRYFDLVYTVEYINIFNKQWNFISSRKCLNISKMIEYTRIFKRLCKWCRKTKIFQDIISNVWKFSKYFSNASSYFFQRFPCTVRALEGVNGYFIQSNQHCGLNRFNVVETATFEDGFTPRNQKEVYRSQLDKLSRVVWLRAL